MLTELINTVKYPVDIYITYDNAMNIKAALHSGSAITIRSFLTPSGSVASKAAVQTGTLCNFYTCVKTAVLLGSRGFKVYANGASIGLETNQV